MMDGRTAWVTGGAGGIGTATVRQLAAQGARVAVLDLVRPASGTRADQAVVCDVADAAAVAEAAAELEAGVGPPDILVNCAGISSRAPVHELTEAQWRHVLGVNLTGPFLLSRQVLSGMMARRWGRIVNISSGSGVRATAGTAAYSASKAGLIGFTKALAHDAAPFGVTANVVAPGITDTPMTRAVWPTTEEMLAMATTSTMANPMKTLLEPDDIAAAVVFLASEGAGHLTGQTLHVNGGSLMA
jgi:2-hydroxycyclohexanecarboxyl-CoA dehydrogenase